MYHNGGTDHQLEVYVIPGVSGEVNVGLSGSGTIETASR
jgi:hypothetical protein